MNRSEPQFLRSGQACHRRHPFPEWPARECANDQSHPPRSSAQSQDGATRHASQKMRCRRQHDTWTALLSDPLSHSRGPPAQSRQARWVRQRNAARSTPIPAPACRTPSLHRSPPSSPRLNAPAAQPAEAPTHQEPRPTRWCPLGFDNREDGANPQDQRPHSPPANRPPRQTPWPQPDVLANHAKARCIPALRAASQSLGPHPAVAPNSDIPATCHLR